MMINLAGHPDPDPIIDTELRRARVCPIWVPRCRREVAASTEGRLVGPMGELSFVRAWRYWVVSGPVPLTVARQLYEDPVGRTDVRVAGHCAAPPPEVPWVKHFDAAGHELLVIGGRDAIPPGPHSDAMAPIYARMVRECRWVENPEAEAALSFVEVYHVDTEVGLRVFADALTRAA